MMADLVPPLSILVGVDVSSQRMALCKKIVKKYHTDAATSGYDSVVGRPRAADAVETSRPCGGEPSARDAKTKQHLPSRVTIRLYCTDGTTFRANGSDATSRGLVFDSNVAREELQSGGKRKRMNKSARARERRRLLEVQRGADAAKERGGDAAPAKAETTKPEDLGDGASVARGGRREAGVAEARAAPAWFDRVLVDAECSTDGALRHAEARRRSAPSSTAAPARRPAWTDANAHELRDLQRRLARAGFRQLKRGGIMVYATCSLSAEQNERVVSWLLGECDDAFVIPVAAPRHLAFVEEGSVPGTVRFNPVTQAAEDTHSQADCPLPGSGFFLAKIGKR